MSALFFKELREYFLNITGYFSICIYLIVTGFFLWIYPSEKTNIIERGIATLDSFFSLSPWLLIVLCSVLMIRSFNSEFSTGTIYFLLTKPVRRSNIVLSKYFAGLVVVWFTILPTLLFYLTLRDLATLTSTLDSSAIFCSYIGLFLLGSTFCSVTLFFSIQSESLVVSFFLSVLVNLFLYSGFEVISEFDPSSWLSGLLRLGMKFHYQNMSRGIIDTRDLLYFLSIIGFFNYASIKALQMKFS